MDAGTETITDARVVAAVQRQARTVHVQALLSAGLLTAAWVALTTR